MEPTTKLQKAGRALLLRLAAEYGPVEAVRILRVADEIEALSISSPRRASTGSETRGAIAAD
jgi:hypothetical protein